jgi:SAM-dependent methyltransferase
MTSDTVSTIATVALTVAAVFVLQRQCGRPWGWPGRLIIASMNRRHAGVTAWGLQHVAIGPDFRLLDIGCGGGRMLRRLAERAPQGRAFGIDHAPASVAAARRLNAEAIDAGRVVVQQGSVSHLPFEDASFELATAVETHYYWPEPVADLREVLRVLAPGGRLLLVAETYRGQRFGAVMVLPMKLAGARYLTPDEHRDLLTAAGFVDVVIHLERGRGWICAVGVKRG